MTKLSKTVQRETSATVRDAGRVRQVIVSLEPTCLIGLRLKGTRTTYYLDAAGAWYAAVRAQAAADARDRRQKRRQRKK